MTDRTTPMAPARRSLRSTLLSHLPALHRVATPSCAIPFVLQIRMVDGARLDIAAMGPAGQAAGTAPLPAVGVVPAVVADGDSRPWKQACRIGERLYTAAFPPRIAHLLSASLEQIGAAPLPIIIATDDEHTAQLPWELLRDPERERFLALSPRTPLSRAPITSSPTSAPVAERGNLRVTLLAESVEEDVLALTSAIGADARVDVEVTDILAASAQPHVVILSTPEAIIPSGVPLVVIAGNRATPPQNRPGDRAALVVPDSMQIPARRTFTTTLTAALAGGEPLDAAVANARRAVADQHSVVGLDWAEPVLVAAAPSAPLVLPARSAAVAAGAEMARKTVSWFRQALTGSFSAVLLLIAGLLVYRLGFSTSNAIELDLLSPFELFTTFKGMILGLSAYEDRFLLIAGGPLLLLTAIVAALWLRNRRIEPEEQPRLLTRLAGPLSSLRTLSFLTMATLTIAGAYAYQQYLWRVVLPIPDGALGLAITREAAAASIRQDLADVLYAQGQSGRIVVRDLPVSFDAGDTERARRLGRRIGAKAVLIYREIDRGDAGTQYAAYVVFTDPSAGLTIGGSPPNAARADPLTPTSGGAEMVQVREGIEIPALRTDTVAELVATAAGVIAYDDNRFREAIALFEQALPEDPSAPNYGIVNFYLGEALRFDDQTTAAAATFERAVKYYETRRDAAVLLTPQDELILAKTYLERGWLALSDSSESAIEWYGKALPLRDSLLARSGQLDRPVEIRATYGRLYTMLADASRRLGKTDDEQQWTSLAETELDALAAETAPDDTATFVREATSRFFIGDCVGGLAALDKVLAVEPESVEANNAVGIFASFQGRRDLAAAAWNRALTLRPNDPVALQQLALLEGQRALGSDYIETTYLESGEALLRGILAVDPANAFPHIWIANWASMRADFALTDGTALLQGDELSVDKSFQLWRADPVRRASALAAMDIVIQERRILATEIDPDNPSAAADLAAAYSSRQNVHDGVVSTVITDPNVSVEDVRADGEAVVADGLEIRDWTGRILAAAAASRLDRLRAWQSLIESVSREWSWAVARGDYKAANALIDERQQILADALAFAESEPATNLDEATPLRAIYSEATILAYFAGDMEQVGVYQNKITEITAWEMGQRRENERLDSTFCREERERNAAATAYATGDLTGARAHYEASLAANPEYSPSLAGLARLLVAQGEFDAVIANATKATEMTPDAADAWSALVNARLAADDTTGAADALNRFFTLTSPLPPQEQMVTVRHMLLEVESLRDRYPERAATIVTVIVRIRAALDAMPAGFTRTFQYSNLYLQLGDLALHAGDPAAAESSFRRAVEIDIYQPAARAGLAIAVLAQGRDATAEIDAAITASRDPFWNWNPIDLTETRRMVLAMMTDQVDLYTTRFPDRVKTVQPLKNAIAAETAALDAGTTTSGSGG